MSEKTDKVSPKKRTDMPIEGRKYAVISPQSIVILAESCGILELNEEIASKIGEDVTYRLREIIQGCSVHMRNSNERILRSTDVARVLPNCSEMKVWGYLSGGSSEFVYVPDADVFVSEYNELIVNLPRIALEKETYLQKGDQFIRGMWFPPDPMECASTEIGASTSTSNAESSASSPPVPAHLIDYYSTFAKIILCKQGRVLKTVLQDLRTNSKIMLIVPYFLNLLIEGLQELPKCSDACEHLLLMLHSLTLNSYIYQDAAVVVSGLLTSLLVYAVDPMPFEHVSITRDIELRELAAEAMVKVMVRWYGCDDAMLTNILQKIQVILLDPSSSVRSHLGALLVLCSFGDEALNCSFWPHIQEYINFLKKLPANSETLEIEGCVLKAAGYLYPQVFRNIEDSSEERNMLVWKMAISDRVLYSYFGDRVCAQWQYPLRHTLVTESGESNEETSYKEIKTELEEFPATRKERASFNLARFIPSRSKLLTCKDQDLSQSPFTASTACYKKSSSIRGISTIEPSWVSSVDESCTSSVSKEGLEAKMGVVDCAEKLEGEKRKLEVWKPGDVRSSGGSLSEMFQLSLVKHNVLEINSIRDLPTWTKRLKRRELNPSHMIFSYSFYHKKCLQLNHVGKFKNVHMSTWCMNFTDVLSTCL